MKSAFSIAFASIVFLPVLAFAQEAQVLRDLEAKQPIKLSKSELQQLLPGAKMSKVSTKGNIQIWSNDPDGTFIASSDNRATARRGRTTSFPAQGKWHISDDGRYCISVEWQRADTEQWCRLIIKTTDGYYAADSDSAGTEKVHRLDVAGK